MAMFEPRRVGRRDPRIALLVAAAVLALGGSALAAATGPPAVQQDGPQGTAAVTSARVSLTAALGEPRLVATRALTDFGLEAGARYVAVRILARVELDVRIVADADVPLDAYPPPLSHRPVLEARLRGPVRAVLGPT